MDSLLTYWSHKVRSVLVEKHGTLLNGIRDISISAGLDGARPINNGILHYIAILGWTGWGYRSFHGIGLDGIEISQSTRNRIGRDRDFFTDRGIGGSSRVP